MAKKVVVVGGGSGGLVAARMVQTEATRLGGDIDVTLISASEKHYMPPLWSEVALGTASPEETWAPIKNAERAYGFKVVVDPVKTFDLPGKKVTTEGGQTFDFDYLVIALGTAYGWSDYKGLDKYGYHNYSEEGALELKKALSTYKGKKVVFLVPELPFRCGIYPPEMAMNVRAYLENRGVHPEISVLYPAPKTASSSTTYSSSRPPRACPRCWPTTASRTRATPAGRWSRDRASSIPTTTTSTWWASTPCRRWAS